MIPNALRIRRKEDEVDLIEPFLVHIENMFGTEAAAWVLDDPGVHEVLDLIPHVQKLILNQRLRTALFLFADATGEDIRMPLSFITEDIDTNTWAKVVNDGVLTYFHKFSLFNVIGVTRISA